MQDAVCHLVQRESSAINFDSFILMAEPLPRKGGEETRVQGENPWKQASENATY